MGNQQVHRTLIKHARITDSVLTVNFLEFEGYFGQKMDTERIYPAGICNGILLDVNCWLAKALVVVGDRTRSGKWVLFFSGPAPQYF